MSDQDAYLFYDNPYDGQPNAVSLIKSALTLLAKTASQEKQMIAGLQLEWLSATGVRVKPGCAYVQGKGLVTVSANIDKTGLSLSASAWYHLYLYDNSGVATVEVVTTAPANYLGSAYQKTADSTRRYLGSVRTDGSGNLLQFLHWGDEIRYLANIDSAPLLVLNAGAATTETSISCANAIPVTARLGFFRTANVATSGGAAFGAGAGASDDSVTPPTSSVGQVLANSDPVQWLPLSASQTISYAYGSAPSGGSLYVNVLGYKFIR